MLEWHVIGMFAPGFFTGHLIRRLGVLPVMGVGLALNLGCIGVALSGVDLHQFVIALFMLGVGWNFLFTGSTTLSLSGLHPRGAGPRAGCAQLLHLRDTGAEFVRVGRAGHDARLAAAQPRIAGPGGADRRRAAVAGATPPQCRGRGGLAIRESGIEPGPQGIEHRLGIALVEDLVVERREAEAADDRLRRRIGKGPAAGRVHEPIVAGV